MFCKWETKLAKGQPGRPGVPKVISVSLHYSNLYYEQ